MTISRTRVKICGMTRANDVRTAVDCGADAIGLVFYPKSGRVVSVEQARALRQTVPAFVSAVALFVDPTVEEVNRVIDQVRPDLLQ
ncbi:MAG TPA: N-(5'-phosphoribosyl)anthranilate isomerase, partial [Burkholderiaceae bacterium]|nr:N-(5'-phosphoribosyl)anthranilate isomerase [Burkholderiaceae bacterium]